MVSDEENWDDESERKNDDNSPIVPLPQTEPIDDDSDVDFDDGATTATVNEKLVPNEIGSVDSRSENAVADDEPPPQQQQQPQELVPLQESFEVEQRITKSFDIFDDTETPTNQPQETAFNNCNDKNNDGDHDLDNDKDIGIVANESAECNTTPLYDEPEEKKDHTEKDEQNDIEVNNASVSVEDEKKLESESPGVPGIDD